MDDVEQNVCIDVYKHGHDGVHIYTAFCVGVQVPGTLKQSNLQINTSAAGQNDMSQQISLVHYWNH